MGIDFVGDMDRRNEAYAVNILKEFVNGKKCYSK